MNRSAIPSMLPLASGHADDSRAAGIPAGNGIPAVAVVEAANEYGKRKVLRGNDDNAVTDEELRSSKRRLVAVELRDSLVPPLGVGVPAILQAINAINASITALNVTMNNNHAELTASVNALTGTINSLATHTFRAANNENVRHGSSTEIVEILLV
jgi:hypothetical protein